MYYQYHYRLSRKEPFNPGETATLSCLMDSNYKPERLVASSPCGPLFSITDISINQEKQFVADEPIPATAFMQSNSPSLCFSRGHRHERTFSVTIVMQKEIFPDWTPNWVWAGGKWWQPRILLRWARAFCWLFRHPPPPTHIELALIGTMVDD